jgi:molecular chaperone DnaJ
VAPHPTLKREGTELIFETSIGIAQAALGARILVPTVEGEEAEVEIKPGTQPGTQIRLRGRGVPHLRRAVRGDLHVIVDVAIPTRLSKAERAALQAYAEASGEIVADGGGILDRVRDALG